MTTAFCKVCGHLKSQGPKEKLTAVAGAGWTSYLGDSMEVLCHLPEDSIEALISDIPYGTGANTPAGRLKAPSEKYRSTGAAPLPDIDGDALLPEAWNDLISTVLRRSRPLLKPGANVLLFCDWRSLPPLLNIVGNLGYSIQGVPVWDKGRGSRPRKNGFRSQSELIVWAKKAGHLDRDDDPVYLDGVLKFSTMSNHKVHLTQKPEPLMDELLRIVPAGGLVLDPFQGSGTTGVSALKAGLQYIGIESVAAYHQIACERLTAAQGRYAS